MEMLNSLKKLFYTRSGEKKKYKILGLTVVKTDKDSTRKMVNVLGIKISKKHRARTLINAKNLKIVKESKLFDYDWYCERYNRVKKSNISPYVDYLRYGYSGAVNPGPIFNSKEYLLMHPDVKAAKIDPLIHYEMWGWKEGRRVSLADRKSPNFPKEAKSINISFSERKSFDKHKVSVFASYSGNGKIEDYVILLLKGLKEISDYVVFVADNPILPEETDKIKDFCNVCQFNRHEEYDFGSYKRGYLYLKDNGILTEDDDLIFLNDSNYGPVYPFKEVIDNFDDKKCDFYGLSVSSDPQKHLQSFFYIFKPQVYNSKPFDKFMRSVKREISAACVVYNYEMTFTQYLSDAGFSYSSYVPEDKFKADVKRSAYIPTKWGKTLLKNYRYPLVKIKAIQGSTVEKPEDILDYVRQENEELYNLILPHIEKKRQSVVKRQFKKVSKYTLHEEYQKSIEKIKLKVQSGEKIKVVFLVNMLSMFPAEALMNEMLKDDLFDVRLFVIPDFRFGHDEEIEMVNETYNTLKEKYPFVKCAVDIKNNEIVEYNDVITDADIVCYPSPYDVSYSLYNPYYAAQNGILSIHINYGFFRSKYDRFIYSLDNYNNFWKVFLETELNLDEYREYGQCQGSNAVVTGYSKMDRMNKYLSDEIKNERKTIIIAPHHSVKGGYNDTLALSNFETYSDLFLELPKLYPQIDFIFRPHPVLFKFLRHKSNWGDERVDSYLEKMMSNKNVVYSTEGDYLETFVKSDGIIQDCGSFLVEYFYTKKPCCYMLKTPDDIETKFSDLGKECLRNCYIAYKKEDIINYIDDVIIDGNDTKKAAREEFAQKEVMVNFPNATLSIINNLKNIFEEKS